MPKSLSSFEDQGMHLSSLLCLHMTDVFVCRSGTHMWDVSQSRIKLNQNQLKGRRVKSTGVMTNLLQYLGQTSIYSKQFSAKTFSHPACYGECNSIS